VTTTDIVLEMVATEREAQEARYGSTNDMVRSGTGPHTAWLLPYTSQGARQIQTALRLDYEDWEESRGLPTWAHLVREELCEAFELPEGDPRLVTELVQVAALCVSWVERLMKKQEAQQ
jgi:hypothetical protein